MGQQLVERDRLPGRRAVWQPPLDAIPHGERAPLLQQEDSGSRELLADRGELKDGLRHVWPPLCSIRGSIASVEQRLAAVPYQGRAMKLCELVLLGEIGVVCQICAPFDEGALTRFA